MREVMSDKLAVIPVSGDPEVFRHRAYMRQERCLREWIKDVKLYLVGPSEVAIATDPGL